MVEFLEVASSFLGVVAMFMILLILLGLLYSRKEFKRETVKFIDVGAELHDKQHEFMHISKLSLKEHPLFKSLTFLEKKCRGKVFIINFEGDTYVSNMEEFTKEISAVLAVAKTETDTVVVKINSGGGTVTGYGAAAMQLERIREAGLKLTVIVEEVAASGGYLMACVADTIVCSPFAMVGSIGVVSEFPNFNKLLTNLKVDYHQLTSGDKKRTISLFAKIDKAGLNHTKSRLLNIHENFAAWVFERREGKIKEENVEKIVSADVFLGEEALQLGLVDHLGNTEMLITDCLTQGLKVYEVKYLYRKDVIEKFAEAVGAQLAKQVEKHVKTTNIFKFKA